MENQGPKIEFAHVTLEVQSANAPRHALLQGVTGYFEAKTLTGIMGPSGGGKTTLLDVLSGVRFKGWLSGALSIGGQPQARWMAEHAMAYVMQQDVLPLLDTPREAITTSALLRLPPSLPRQSKLDRVEHLLDLLDLQDCAGVLIGDNTQGMRGISGGQRRRVAIAIELVKDPSLVFLDEPLTGLDSEMADTVGACLSRLAREEGKTVVMSLHQASRRLYKYMDGLMLMAGGHLVYCGAFGGAQPYLQSLGYSMLQEQTPAEFMIMVLRSWQHQGTAGTAGITATGALPLAHGQQPEAVTENTAVSTGRKPLGIPDLEAATLGQAGLSEKHFQAAMHLALLMMVMQEEWEVAEAFSLAPAPMRSQLLGCCTGREDRRARADDKRPASPLWQQLQVLLARNFRWLRRDWTGTLSFLASSLVTGLFAGFIFFNLSSTMPAAVQDRLGLLWLILATLLFSYNLTTIAVWERGRQLLRREHSTGLYAITPYFLAHCGTWAAYSAAALVLLSVLYFIAQLQLVASKYFIFYGVLVLMAYAADLMGMIMAVLAPDNTTAVALQAAVALLLIASSGFLSRDIPVYLRWLQQSSFMTYAYTSLALNEFLGLTLQAGGQEGADVPVGGLEALKGTGVVHTSWGLGANVAVLGGITGVSCGVAYLSLCLVAKLQRL